MLLIASTKMVDRLPDDVGFGTDTTIKNNDSDPSFYSTAHLSNVPSRPTSVRHSRLLLSLILIGATVSFTEAYLLVKKHTGISQTQIAEIETIERVQSSTIQ